MKTPIHLIHLQGCSIYQQLELEEALLRAHSENYCLINLGTPDAIVLGISSKLEEMVHVDQISNPHLMLIQRFSGGGTVYVDSNTLFVTFVLNQKDIPIIPYPEPILKWGEQFYHPVFQKIDFHLRENDYTVGFQKIGGNALYIRKERWLLHTSFLWDYSIQNINLLKEPLKRPKYREKRRHQEFITPLCAYYPEATDLIQKLIQHLDASFDIQKTWTTYPSHLLHKEHRKTLRFLIGCKQRETP